MTNEQKGSYDLVVLEFERQSKKPASTGSEEGGEQLVAWWFGNETFDLELDNHTSMVHVPPEPTKSRSGRAGAASSTGANARSSEEVEVLTAGAGGVERERHEVAAADREKLKRTSAVAASSYDCSDTCIIDLCIHGIRDFNWKCLLLIAGSAFTTGVACIGCAVSGPLMIITCPACAISAGLMFHTIARCTSNYGNCIDHESVEVPTEWLDDNDIECDDVHATNDEEYAVHEDSVDDIPTC